MKIKHWTKTEVLNCINDRVNEALEKHHQSKIKKVSLKKLHMIYKESILGLFDFYESCHVNEFNYFENVIYNKMDFGNYLWGAAMEKLKISNFNTWLGSNLNAILAGKNQTRHFVKFHLKDSREDQKAIFRGKKWYQGAK